mmetsp:Transcript_10379/g.31245  ORF Transcript_10379/g.31245 Transcript_10379/m.31245 type:complete len:224 (+) Transcript_10379:1281-1952(+)
MHHMQGCTLFMGPSAGFGGGGGSVSRNLPSFRCTDCRTRVRKLPLSRPQPRRANRCRRKPTKRRICRRRCHKSDGVSSGDGGGGNGGSSGDDYDFRPGDSALLHSCSDLFAHRLQLRHRFKCGGPNHGSCSDVSGGRSMFGRNFCSSFSGGSSHLCGLGGWGAAGQGVGHAPHLTCRLRRLACCPRQHVTLPGLPLPKRSAFCRQGHDAPRLTHAAKEPVVSG